MTHTHTKLLSYTPHRFIAWDTSIYDQLTNISHTYTSKLKNYIKN